MFSSITSGFSTKTDGNLRLMIGSTDNEASRNRERYFSKLGPDSSKIVSAELVHGNRLVKIDRNNISRVIMDCDALISSEPDIVLSITAADCLPIYFYDQNKKVVALAHAGWRGTISNIVKKVIDSFLNDYNSNPKDIEVFIGPHIKSCHFEIRADILDQFKDYSEYISKNDGKININLAGIISKQLSACGLKKENIMISEECTYCLPKKYFSYRRDNPEELETMLAYIGLNA